MHPDNIRGRWRRLQRGRLVYGGSDLSIEGETRLRRGGLVYKGGGSSRDYTIDAIENVLNGPNTVQNIL
jgi:hypothetical protein